MARTKRRQHGFEFGTGIAPFPPSAATGGILFKHFAPNSHQETFLRGAYQLNMSVAVNAVGFDIPPENWWTQTFIMASMFWMPSTTSIVQPVDTFAENFLGSSLLEVRRFETLATTTEYAVTWSMDEPLIVQTARQSPTATGGPEILFQVSIIDPGFVFSGTYADISVNYGAKGFSLWEDP